jgi:hypothetical protein
VLPALSKELFDSAIRELLENKALSADRGWLFLNTTYPRLLIAVAHRRSGKIRGFEFDFTDWNDQPPALRLVDVQTLEALPGSLWPRDSSGRWHASGWISAGGVQTQIPFMCMVGIREYHTHQSHVGDNWSNHRDSNDYTIANIVVQVTEAFQKADV